MKKTENYQTKSKKIGNKTILAIIAIAILYMTIELAMIMFTKSITFYDKDRNEITAFDLEIADTEETRKTGLMHREKLAKDTGMLFIFPKEQLVAMWMKNTKIPLDMIFIDENNIVQCVRKNTTPESLLPVGCLTPVLYVLEVNAGLSDEHGIKAGNTVKISK